MKLPLPSATLLLVPPSHETALPHSPAREAARGGNRSKCHSLQDQRNSLSPWRIKQGPGSCITPVTLGCSEILAEVRYALRRGARGGPVPRQAQTAPLPEAAPRLQVEHPCKPFWSSSLSPRFTHASTSRQPAETRAAKRKGTAWCGPEGLD